MKKIIFGILTIALIAIGGFLAANPDQLESLGFNVTGVQAQESEGQAAATESTISTGTNSVRNVVADASVVPSQYAALSMLSSGIVAEILVEEGESVAAGETILRLRNSQQIAAVRQAEAQLLRAQAYLDELRGGARIQEIEQSEAALDAAQARLARLTEGARTEEIAAAESSLASARVAYAELFTGPSGEAEIAAKAELANAEAARDVAQRAYNDIKWRNDVGMTPQAQQLMEATNNFEASLARYNDLFADPDPDQTAAANAQIKQAEAELDRLRAPGTDAEIAEAEAEVRRAQASLDLIKAGNRSETIAAATADLMEAEARLAQAQAALEDSILFAPFGGVLAALDVRVGEQVAPGSAVAQLADLSTWQIETEDLTEIGVVDIQEGDDVLLTFDALDDLELSGTVVRIKPIGESKQGDITYTAIIEPEEQDSRLRWNMTAVATIN